MSSKEYILIPAVDIGMSELNDVGAVLRTCTLTGINSFQLTMIIIRVDPSNPVLSKMALFGHRVVEFDVWKKDSNMLTSLDWALLRSDVKSLTGRNGPLPIPMTHDQLKIKDSNYYIGETI